jgi:hypothetical protein
MRMQWPRGWQFGDSIGDSAFVEALRLLGPGARAAMFAASLDGPLKRRSWDGCPLSRAGKVLGELVGDECSASQALGLSPGQVRSFLSAWDRLPGSNRSCTKLLRRTIAALDGYPLDSRNAGPNGNSSTLLTVDKAGHEVSAEG